MVEEGDDWQNVEVPAEAPPTPTSQVTVAQSAPSPTPASSSPPSPADFHADLHAHGLVLLFVVLLNIVRTIYYFKHSFTAFKHKSENDFP